MSKLVDNWIPIETALEFVRRTQWMCPKRNQVDRKYIELRIDTRDSRCLVFDRERSELISAKAVREFLAEDIEPCRLSRCCATKEPASVVPSKL